MILRFRDFEIAPKQNNWKFRSGGGDVQSWHPFKKTLPLTSEIVSDYQHSTAVTVLFKWKVRHHGVFKYLRYLHDKRIICTIDIVEILLHVWNWLRKGMDVGKMKSSRTSIYRSRTDSMMNTDRSTQQNRTEEPKYKGLNRWVRWTKRN